MAQAAQQTSNTYFKNLNDFLNQAATLGKEEANGALKRPEFARKLALAASEGFVTPKEAEKAWTAFRRKAAGIIDGVVIADKKDESSSAVRISECTQIIKASMNTDQIDFVDVLNRAAPLITQEARANNKVKGNLWDNFVKLARFQLKAENKTKTLTDEQIVEALTPPKVEKEHTEEKALEKLLATMEKIVDGTNDTDTSQGKEGFPSDELDKAIHLVKKRLTELRQVALKKEFETKMAALKGGK